MGEYQNLFENLKETVGAVSFAGEDITQVELLMRRLEENIFANRDLDLNGSATEFSQLARLSRPLYSQYEVRLEQMIASEIAEGELPRSTALSQLERYDPVRRTFRYAALEAGGMGVSSKSRFAHIGCGGLPETLIGIHLVEEDASLAGVDMDPLAITQAHALLKAVGVENVELIQANGAEVNYSNFSHILVAVLVRPEIETVARICQTTSRDFPVTVGLRRALGVAQALYEDISNESVKLLEEHGFEQRDRVSGHAVMETDIFKRDS